MIPRNLAPKLQELAGFYPVVVVTGPRQSGKTTLCQATFPDHAYVSLESLDYRDFAVSDPRGFLSAYADGVVIDEIQHAPGLLSYLQTEVDQQPDPGRFILTGSQHLGLSALVSQSLAGRSGHLTLLPPSLDELRAFESAPEDLYALLWQGSYPRIYDREIPAHRWLSDYATTYLERDVRQVVNVGDLRSFERFLKLCAGRTSQELNLTTLASDAGVAVNTVKSWLSVLGSGFIVDQTPAWHPNIRKQVVKAPKLHFLDSGLACFLLGIRSQDELRLHPLRGAVFESWVFSEVMKTMVHSGRPADLYHYRENRGPEVDLLLRQGTELVAIEAKSGETASSDMFRHLGLFEERVRLAGGLRIARRCVVYGGDASQNRTQGRLVSWRDVNGIA